MGFAIPSNTEEAACKGGFFYTFTLMTSQSGTKIYNGNATGLDYSDFTVGIIGLIGAGSQFAGDAIPCSSGFP